MLVNRRLPIMVAGARYVLFSILFIMILACPHCRSSFLIADTIFGHEPRTVRCGMCHHSWHQRPTKAQATLSPAPVDGGSSRSLAGDVDDLPLELTQTMLPPLTLAEVARSFVAQDIVWNKRARMMNLWLKARIQWRQVSKAVLIYTLGFVFFGLVAILGGHGSIVRTWPEVQTIYVAIGWVKDPLKDNLILLDTTSLREYRAGAMHLVVRSTILSRAKKTQVIPDINAEALGVDGRVIQSWRIKPPVATLDPGKMVRLTSVVLSPRENVVDVTLSFTQPPHEHEE